MVKKILLNKMRNSQKVKKLLRCWNCGWFILKMDREKKAIFPNKYKKLNKDLHFRFLFSFPPLTKTNYEANFKKKKKGEFYLKNR